MLFGHEICNLDDWGRYFTDPHIFEPLVKYICNRHHIPYSGIGPCTPGSNAVFRMGGYIMKIFAPEESEIGGENDFLTEKYGIARANRLGIPAPRLVADGVLKDSYIFRYLVLTYIDGQSLHSLSPRLSSSERIEIGCRLREIIGQMDTPCDRFNNHTLYSRTVEDKWTVFPSCFQKERTEYLRAHSTRTPVYIHGDLCADNMMLDANHNLFLIDFADAMLAPIELEFPALICDGFGFDPDYMEGFLGKYDKSSVTEDLLYGLLAHDYGSTIIRDTIGVPSEILSLDTLRYKLLSKL